MRASLVLLSSLLVCFAGSGWAHADVLPQDGCTMPGQPCQNAGPSHNQPGLCTPSTCSKQLPSWDAPMSYPCSVCQLTDAGVTGGTAGSAGAAGASGSSGSAGTGGTTGPGGAPG